MAAPKGAPGAVPDATPARSVHSTRCSKTLCGAGSIGEGVVVCLVLTPRQNVLAAHGSQGPPAGPENPSLHMQSVALLLSAGALESPAQALRSPLEQNVSAGHGAHGPPAGPENPSLQMQSVASLLTASALESPAHAVRSPLEQNVSSGHGSHGPPAGPENPSLQMQSAASLLSSGSLDSLAQISGPPVIVTVAITSLLKMLCLLGNSEKPPPCADTVTSPFAL
eukprot:3086242-Rhodomonas_salina.1